jgi:hypothetical protein
MRIIRSIDESKEECLQRAREYEWMADTSPNPHAAAYCWDRARLWRSLYYVAKPAKLPLTPMDQLG